MKFQDWLEQISGTIRNLGISGNVKGSYSTGAIAGNNKGIIENCYNLATIESNNGNEIGGITGNNHGIIKECYNNGKIIGINYIGGIVGLNYGEVINCYNTGNLDHIRCMHKGGIAAESREGTKIINCYNVGLVGNTLYNNGSILGTNAGVDMNNCYGLNNEKIEIVGFSEVVFENCAMKSEEEMKTKEFLDLLDSNTEKKWKKSEVYPKLYWE